MKVLIYGSVLLLFILVACFISVYLYSLSDGQTPNVNKGQFHLQCYFTDWSYSRNGIGKFTPDDLPNEYCTHYLYAFALYDPKENALKPAEPTVDTEFYKNLTDLKRDGKVVILSVGGWVDSTDKYHEMLKDDQVRKMFAKNSVEYVVKYNFHGIDLDLEYPTTWQAAENANWTSDRENFVKLLKEIRVELDAKQVDDKDNKLFLSLAAGAGKRVLKNGYDVKSIMEVVDWVSLMTYDIHGEWEAKTGLVAPLTAQPGDKSSDINVKEVIQRWIANGAKPEKLVLGIPLYGKSFTLSSTNYSIGAPASVGLAGEYTQENGTLAYYEIVDNVKNKGWNSTRIPQVGSYAYKDNQWVGYDNPEDVALKAEYVKDMNLLGSMVWAIDMDCFQKNGPCEKRYELLHSISTAFKK